MNATNQYLKRRTEYNVAHTKFLFTTLSSHRAPHKIKIARWVKNTFSKAGLDANIFSSHNCNSSGSSKA